LQRDSNACEDSDGVYHRSSDLDSDSRPCCRWVRRRAARCSFSPSSRHRSDSNFEGKHTTCPSPTRHESIVAHALALSSERRQRSGAPGAKPWPKQAAASAVIESAWLQGCNAVNAADAKVYPFVHVIGIPKAGTSYLYKLLTSSPYIEPASRHKEYCPSDVKFDKTRYSDGFRLAETMTTRTANGCIDTRQALQLHACVSPFLRFQPKYIMTIRPPDEYQWARYNFWTNQLDARHSPGKWTDGDSYRSPEMFHELHWRITGVVNRPVTNQRPLT
jgi:hypothetical protein